MNLLPNLDRSGPPRAPFNTPVSSRASTGSDEVAHLSTRASDSSTPPSSVDSGSGVGQRGDKRSTDPAARRTSLAIAMTEHSGPPSSAMPISISTNVSASSMRLSTTPLFPSPLAQASGPHHFSKGDGGDGGDSEDEPALHEWRRTAQVEHSPLRRDSSALFGGMDSPSPERADQGTDLDLSPSTSSIGLPHANALGFETATPRQTAGGHRRSLSGRESSSDVDASRTARAVRVKSIGRASGLSYGFGDEGSVGRRRSRASDLAAGGAGAGQGPGGSYPGLLTTPRTLSVLSTSPPAGSPPSPTHSSPTSPVSRRGSLHLLSPGRTYAPLSPSASRSPRSSLSAAMAVSIPSPFPAPPPPNESIKRQRVPESVLSAQDFRLPSGPSFVSEVLGGALSLPGPGFVSSPGAMGTSQLPKTPQGTRAPSPASLSGSGSLSDVRRSQDPSKDSSRASSRRGSSDKVLTLAGTTAPATASPVFIPGHSTSASGSSSSAFSPLFPFPSSPATTSSPRVRDRARSVLNPSTNSTDPFKPTFRPEASTSKARQQHHDLGVSPLTHGLSPLSLGSGPPQRIASDGAAPIDFTSAQRQGRGLLAGKRTSGSSTGSISLLPEGTDEYAQIIIASRNAKMRKWKANASTSVPGSAAFDPPLEWSTFDRLSSRRSIPVFGEEVGTIEESETSDNEGDSFGAGKGSKEIEWVDWLDEYRIMKEAKTRAEEGDQPAQPPARPLTKGARESFPSLHHC